MKSDRHAKILELINEQDIETQEELTRKLKEAGYNATQATVSRDINELGLVKVAYGKNKKNSKYKYSLNNQSHGSVTKLADKYKNILSQAMISVDYARNIVVVKTYPGLAQGAAAAVDALDVEHIVGNVAGDDTIIVIMRTDEYAKEFTARLNDLKKTHN